MALLRGRREPFPTKRVYFSRPKGYITLVPGIAHYGPITPSLYAPSLYAPSLRLKRLAYSCYGVGHTAWRHPGDMRGTVVGKHGRFRSSTHSKEVMFRA
jgi:hypothetical protein